MEGDSTESHFKSAPLLVGELNPWLEEPDTGDSNSSSSCLLSPSC